MSWRGSDRLARHEVAAIIEIQAELRKARRGRGVLRRTARLLGVSVPTLDRVMLTWRGCRASTVRRVRAAIAQHAGQCLRHNDCAEVPVLGRACMADRTT